MSVLTLLLASFFAGFVGLLFKTHRQRFLSPVFVFPMKMLLSELKKNGFWSWRNLFRRQGEALVYLRTLCTTKFQFLIELIVIIRFRLYSHL